MVMITLGPARSRLLERATAPVAEPLTLAETKLYLRVSGGDEDALIGDMIASARIMAEQWLRRSL
ncbi:MAG: head-tail connector protein, partial [Rickettsiales bacterium]|nr:head-tail connector protein [Rickettsiales bacterium]